MSEQTQRTLHISFQSFRAPSDLVAGEPLRLLPRPDDRGIGAEGDVGARADPLL